MRRRFRRRRPAQPRGPRTNNQIRLTPVLVIDEKGENLGEMDTRKAIALAQERGLDLVEVGPNVRPPVCRIVDAGKYKYEQAKRTREQRRERKTVKSEVKGVRITFRASQHDLLFRAKQADTFLEEGHTVRIEMTMRGREKGKVPFAKERMQGFLEMLTVPSKIQQEARRGGRGLEMILVRDRKAAKKPAEKKTPPDKTEQPNTSKTLPPKS